MYNNKGCVILKLKLLFFCEIIIICCSTWWSEALKRHCVNCRNISLIVRWTPLFHYQVMQYAQRSKFMWLNNTWSHDNCSCVRNINHHSQGIFYIKQSAYLLQTVLTIQSTLPMMEFFINEYWRWLDDLFPVRLNLTITRHHLAAMKK